MTNMSKTTDTPAELDKCVGFYPAPEPLRYVIKDGQWVPAPPPPADAIPDPLYASPDKQELCAGKYNCPHCGEGTLGWSAPYAPWTDGHWTCNVCDSTFCDLPVHEKAPVHAPVNTAELVKLVKEVLQILNETEESDSGTVFHPTTISSCRTMNVTKLRELFSKLEQAVNYPLSGKNSPQ